MRKEALIIAGSLLLAGFLLGSHGVGGVLLLTVGFGIFGDD
jgi:uncharacterized membrane protein YfcA